MKPQRAGAGFDTTLWTPTGRASVLACSLALWLSACATPPAPPPTAVLDAIQREMNLAAQLPGADKAPLDLALLPPMQTEPARRPEARFDISVQNAPASQVFNAIVADTPFSMLVPPDLSGTVTLTLKKVTVLEVLDTLRDLYGYDYRVEGNRIFAMSTDAQTRVFQVNYLTGSRRGSTNVSLNSTSISGSGTSGTSNSPAPAAPTNSAQSPTSAARTGGGASVSTESGNDFWVGLESALGVLVGTSGSVNVNRFSGVVVVRAAPRAMREVEKYLKTTAGVIERQVMLEAKIIEVSLSEEFQSGVNWAAFGSARSNGSFIGNFAMGSQSPGLTLPATGGTSGSISARNTAPSGQTGVTGIVTGATVGAIATGMSRGFYGMAFQSGEFAALLSFLESQGTVHVLSSPRVATVNNQKAVLKVGNDEFFVTNVATTTTSGTGATTTSPTVTLQPFFSGIALDVTPQIDSADQIILHVHPSISTVSEKTKTIDLGTGGSLSLPLAASSINESDAIVRVRDGQIVAIGGLMRQRQAGDRSGLPGTTGTAVESLFGQKARSLTKSELVILIKPTVLRDDRDWQVSLQEANQRLQEYAPSRPVHIVRP